MRRSRRERVEIQTITYKGIEIVFDPTKDEWFYTLRGRDRKCKTLGAVMKEIDKPAPRGGKPFERIQVYRRGSGRWDDKNEEFKTVTVTSIANDKYPYPIEVWISDGDNRSKVSPDTCYLINDKNKGLIKSINNLEAQIKTLEKLRDEQQESMDHLVIDREEQ